MLIPKLILSFGLIIFALMAEANTLEDIQKTKVLKVCIWPDYFGISYRNPRSGALQGLDINLSRDFAQELGVKPQYVETSFAGFIADVENRNCHIAMMGVGVIPSRAERVNFSAPYLRSDVYAVTSKSNTTIKTWDDLDRPGRVISVLKGTFMEPLMKQTLKQATLQVAERPGERERDVESGRSDAFMTDYPYTQRMLANTDWARVVSPTRPIQPTDYAYAVAKGDAAWLARVNQFVAQAKKDGRLDKYATEFKLQQIVVKD
ncbi:substrate-binding periplasmic protein [Polynucleobacter yangtzensis]|uniref:Cyclohexadienyl dehydratase n=1 Tax=Polynucleobacter yangtzensis TaxID=1743159 RepID=A0ABM8CMA9_9BURK|nr:ABC transporter substrate-binding protein [Polynucleobacter yangtzensis]BDT78984.1 cyclohexadienyl dehydratase [Polynucleobacter yangtzensis]